MNNQTTITGVIYAKPTRTGKAGTQYADTIYTSIILETDNPMSSKKTFPEFELGGKATPDDYAIGDPIEITYCLTGAEWKYEKDGKQESKFFTRAKAIYIKHLDTEIKRETGNDTAFDKRQQAKREAEVWSPPNPLTDDKEDDGDLPF
jgi:hypothetical protein